jgi:adenine-specific DNA-methyltransferase
MGGKTEKELLYEVEDLRTQLEKLKARKKYGLVWDAEREPEKVVLDCRKKLPILIEDKGREIKGKEDEPVNLLIEGDNYHSLSVLNYTHKEKIDVIYIDPPYNTEKEGFTYNDRRVDMNDGYRHSKWLNFMEKRLKSAKSLLSKSGAIFISIDKNEFAQLKLLCDSIFGESNFVGEITRKQSSGSKNDTGSNKLITNVDKVLIYSNEKFKFLPISHENGKKYTLKDKDGNYSTRALEMQGGDDTLELRPRMGYSIYHNPKENSIKLLFDYSLENQTVYEREDPDLIKKGYTCYRPRKRRSKEGIWRWGKEKFVKEFNNNNLCFIGDRVFQKEREKRFLEKYPDSLCLDFINTQGTLEVKSILSEDKFSFPKPVGLIKYLLQISTKENSTILDFFAGSGTTGHAILELNKEDGGKRKCILCTNNENNICEKITYPRIKNVIEGYKFKGKNNTLLFEKKVTLSDLNKFDTIYEEFKDSIEENRENYDEIKREFKDNTLKIIGIKNITDKKEGLGGNLRYYKTDFVETEDLDHATDQDKINLTYKTGEMIAIKENTFEEIEQDDWWQIFSGNKGITAVYFKEDKSKLQKLVEKLDKMNKKVNLYIFSWGKNEYTNEFPEYKNIKVKDIPEPLIEIYKEVAKL